MARVDSAIALRFSEERDRWLARRPRPPDTLAAFPRVEVVVSFRGFGGSKEGIHYLHASNNIELPFQKWYSTSNMKDKSWLYALFSTVVVYIHVYTGTLHRKLPCCLLGGYWFGGRVVRVIEVGHIPRRN